MRIDVDTTRDSILKSVILGISLPLLILSLTIFNLISLRVFWAEPDGPILIGTAQDHFLIFLGAVVCKLSVAGGFFSWFYMGNDKDRLEKYYQQSLLGCMIGFGVGVLLILIGFFVHFW